MGEVIISLVPFSKYLTTEFPRAISSFENNKPQQTLETKQQKETLEKGVKYFQS